MRKTRTHSTLALVLTMILLTFMLPGVAENAGLPTDKQVHLTVMTNTLMKGVFDTNAEGAEYTDYFNYVAKRFTEMYPNVTIEVQAINGSERAAILNTALQSEKQPDVFFDTVMALTDYAHLGALAPLDDIVEEDRSDIEEGLWKLGIVGDQLYFYPFAQSTGVYQVNREFFGRAGLADILPPAGELGKWTVEEYENVLKTLKASITDDGFYPMGFYCANNQSDQFSNTLLKMYGGEIFNEDSSACIANDPLTVKGMETIKSWADAGYIQPSPESATYITTREMFRNRQLAIVSTSSSNALADLYDMQGGVIPAFDVSYFTIPGTQSLSMLYGGCVFQQKDPDRVAFAKEFVRFFSTDEELVTASAILALPVRRSVMEKVAGQNQAADIMMQASPYVKDFTGNIPNYVEFRNLLYPTFQAVFTGLKDPQTAMDDLANDATELIEEGRSDSVLF